MLPGICLQRENTTSVLNGIEEWLWLQHEHDGGFEMIGGVYGCFGVVQDVRCSLNS